MWTLAWYQLYAGQLDESAATSRKLLELNPAYATAQAQYGLTLLLMGKKSEALAAAQKESDEASKFATLACVYWAMGRRTESDSALGALERGFADRDAYGIASGSRLSRGGGRGVTWLGRAYQTNKGFPHRLKADPLLRNLRGDPRFDALLRKVKLVE